MDNLEIKDMPGGGSQQQHALRRPAGWTSGRHQQHPEGSDVLQAALAGGGERLVQAPIALGGEVLLPCLRLCWEDWEQLHRLKQGCAAPLERLHRVRESQLCMPIYILCHSTASV